MREIISLFIGSYGVQCGEKVLEQICYEHNINNYGEKVNQQENPSAEDKVSCFFSESSKQKFVPRTIFFDTDPTPIDELRKKGNELFHSENLISCKEDSAGNCAKAIYSTQRFYKDVVLEAIRKESEKCDSLQGFIIHRSLNGGTGVGFGGQISQSLSSDYKKILKVSNVLFPSNNISNEVVEPYNFAHSIHSIMEHSDINIIFQNEQLYNFCDTHLGIEEPDYSTINQLISQVHSSLTSTIRFGGDLNLSIPNLVANLVPFPKASLIIPSYSSSSLNYNEVNTERISTISLCQNAFKKQNFLVGCSPQQGKYLSCSLNLRGDITQKEIYQSINLIKSKNTIRFMDWCPTGFKVGINNQKPPNFLMKECSQFDQKDALLLANNTAISKVLDINAVKFDDMFYRRIFVFWYVGEGMEEGEFHEAREDLQILQNTYGDIHEEEDREIVYAGDEE